MRYQFFSLLLLATSFWSGTANAQQFHQLTYIHKVLPVAEQEVLVFGEYEDEQKFTHSAIIKVSIGSKVSSSSEPVILTDPEFQPPKFYGKDGYARVYGVVNKLSTDAAGNIVATGAFSEVNGVPAPAFAKLTSKGALISSWTAPVLFKSIAEAADLRVLGFNEELTVFVLENTKTAKVLLVEVEASGTIKSKVEIPLKLAERNTNREIYPKLEAAKVGNNFLLWGYIESYGNTNYNLVMVDAKGRLVPSFKSRRISLVPERRLVADFNMSNEFFPRRSAPLVLRVAPGKVFLAGPFLMQDSIPYSTFLDLDDKGNLLNPQPDSANGWTGAWKLPDLTTKEVYYPTGNSMVYLSKEGATNTVTSYGAEQPCSLCDVTFLNLIQQQSTKRKELHRNGGLGHSSMVVNDIAIRGDKAYVGGSLVHEGFGAQYHGSRVVDGVRLNRLKRFPAVEQLIRVVELK